MKNHIFEVLKGIESPLAEIVRIDNMLQDNNGVLVSEDLFNVFCKGTPISIYSYIDKYLLKNWKHRGTCISCTDLKKKLGIDILPQTDAELTLDYLLTYMEYVANLIYLLSNNYNEKDTLSDNVDAIYKNIKIVLNKYNYEVKEFSKECKVMVVLKHALANSVAESVNSANISYSLIDYNHYLLKGDISKKKDILLALGKELEGRRKELKAINNTLEDRIFFILNNLDLRHNNRKKGNSNYIERVAKMRKPELEKWYDELYELILTAFNLLNNKERINRVTLLKQEITP